MKTSQIESLSRLSSENTEITPFTLGSRMIVLSEINPNGHIVDESIKGYLTFAEVDCYLREISEY